ncbi:MAG: IS607 family transposase [Xenococcaceae cyanobacterium MO_167.B52]|nr:IS607 family transposase [Xenococcaceae cyanobacterium MO_167.B52]
MPKLSISEAAYLLGVSTDTLRRWEKEGKITSTRTEGGHRRYDLTDILKDKEDDGLTILYARVSTRPQIKDLDRQIAVLETYAEIKGWKNCKTIKDIGSGVNYRKKGLNKLLSILVEGQATRLVLTTKDRLLRFGSELVFSICELYGVEIVILNKDPDSSPEEELVKDVLEIITVFSAKLHSMKSRKNVLKDTAPHIKALQENLKKLAQLDE